MPLTAAALVVGGLGLVGVPMTAGFVSKWFLVQAAFEAGLWPVAMLILIGSLVALAYVGRIIEAIYFRPPDPKAAPTSEAPWTMLLPTWLLIGASIYFGLHTSLTIDVAETAARGLLGSGL